ncbi:hypothetical protein IWQ56_002113 [Coemansia nantahalensis]|nr:hypothetical protein IWQ56_002113 [Coemansia nantahalensis]
MRAALAAAALATLAAMAATAAGEGRPQAALAAGQELRRDLPIGGRAIGGAGAENSEGPRAEDESHKPQPSSHPGSSTNDQSPSGTAGSDDHSGPTTEHDTTTTAQSPETSTSQTASVGPSTVYVDGSTVVVSVTLTHTSTLFSSGSGRRDALRGAASLVAAGAISALLAAF